MQQARREAGLKVVDRIRVTIAGPAEIAAAVGAHRAWVAEQTLATELDITLASDQPPGDGWQSVELPDATTAWLHLQRWAG